MIQFSDLRNIKQYLLDQQGKGASTGFVPTMGALHQGHMELIKQAKREVDIVICSIFVNPLQFNRQVDLDSYPNRMEADKAMLEKVGCDVLFSPKKKDIYPEEPKMDFDFGSIGQGMEAEYRPGHFEGVAAVIDRFFTVLEPSKAYFGEKDFQQLAIVRWLVEKKGFNTKIVGCKTVRFENGLAMSSRNYNLAENDFEKASKIYKLMYYCKENKDSYTPKQLQAYCFQELEKEFEPEYVVIADECSMKSIEKWEESSHPRVFIAAYLSTVRLIDNLSLID